MREFGALSVEEAREVWIHSIDLLLPPTPVPPSTTPSPDSPYAPLVLVFTVSRSV